jgi:hypothetical protein
LEHYGLAREKINARQAHENGDVESSHRHFKDAVSQAFMLRGSNDFPSREAYAAFLQAIVVQRNAGRAQRLAEERSLLRPLPAQRRETCQRLRVRVTRGSMIRVQNNTYSVHSRLIGEQVEARIYAERLEVWLGDQHAEQLPRLRGRSKYCVNYRHIIDQLLRKPGAFTNYRYREALFPTSRFRIAFDWLAASQPSRSVKEYLRILQLAAHESEARVDDALRTLLDSEAAISAAVVEKLLRSEQAACATTEVHVPPPDLSLFDVLLTDMEVYHERSAGCEVEVGGVFEGAASSGCAGELRGVGSASGGGVAQL